MCEQPIEVVLIEDDPLDPETSPAFFASDSDKGRSNGNDDAERQAWGRPVAE